MGSQFGRGPPPPQQPQHHDQGHHCGGNGPWPFITPLNATANLQPKPDVKKASTGGGSGAAPVSTPFTLQPVKVSTPGYMQSSLLKLGPCGGVGGLPFSTPLDENTKLLSVKVWEGPGGIAGIQAKYELSGVITTSPVWGTNQQDTQNFNEVSFDVENGEIFISFTGTLGKSSECGIVVVQSLSLVTNVATYGPMGNAKDSTAREFSLTAGTGGQIIGYFGFSRALLESVGVLAKPPPALAPAPAAETVPSSAAGLVLQGPSGGAEGQEFTMDVNADVKFVMCLVSLLEDAVIGLQLWYEKVKGEFPSRYVLLGANSRPEGDIAFQQVVFGEDGGRSLTCVKGTVGTCKGKAGDTLAVKSVTFVTDDGVTHGPFGNEEGGVPFSYIGKIVGCQNTAFDLGNIGKNIAFFYIFSIAGKKEDYSPSKQKTSMSSFYTK